MLVLSRRLQEQIRIGDQVTITILRVKGNTVRIGIEAPRNTRIVRAELGELPPEKPIADEKHAELERGAESRQEFEALLSEDESAGGTEGNDRRSDSAAETPFARQARLNVIKNRLRGHWPTPVPN